MIDAWKKLETVVVLDHQWTASCRFADIVLPVTTRFERNDIEQFGTHSNKGLMALHQIVKPQYEARHDFDVFAGLCKRFDKEAVYRENRDEMQWIQRAFDEGVKMGASPRRLITGFHNVLGNRGTDILNIRRGSRGYVTVSFATSQT